MFSAALCVVAVLATSPGFTEPPDFAKSPHVEHRVSDVEGGEVEVRLTFKDFTGQLVTVGLRASRAALQEAADAFGAPDELRAPYLVTQAAERRAQLARRMMRVRGGSLGADPHAVVRAYDGVTRPIARTLIDVLARRSLDSRANRIAMALSFVQDFPYGVVRDEPGRFRQGIAPAPLMLLQGYGDCDSKALFFAGLMAAMVGLDDVALLTNSEEGHSLAAVRGTPGPGQTSIEVRGARFILMEVAGPARFAPGEVGAHSPQAFEIDWLGEATERSRG